MSSGMEQLAGEQAEDDVDSLREKIKRTVRKYDVGIRFTNIRLPKASILLPLLIKNGKLHLLLTVRSMQLKTMPGDVCFPGGRREPRDKDDIQTALRETSEEVGLHPDQVEIVGRLVPYVSVSPQYLITPVVAIVKDPFEICPDPDEVTDVFVVPLEFFIGSEHYTPIFLNVPHFGEQTIHSFYYEDMEKKKIFKIWGLTAHFALLISVILLEKGPAFDCNYNVQNVLVGCENALLTRYESKL
ncbi:peroxisomal coenzyme A diphosphatase NUDT7 [Rhinophrynus dorsalis]